MCEVKYWNVKGIPTHAALHARCIFDVCCTSGMAHGRMTMSTATTQSTQLLASSGMTTWPLRRSLLGWPMRGERSSSIYQTFSRSSCRRGTAGHRTASPSPHTSQPPLLLPLLRQPPSHSASLQLRRASGSPQLRHCRLLFLPPPPHVLPRRSLPPQLLTPQVPLPLQYRLPLRLLSLMLLSAIPLHSCTFHAPRSPSSAMPPASSPRASKSPKLTPPSHLPGWAWVRGAHRRWLKAAPQVSCSVIRAASVRG